MHASIVKLAPSTREYSMSRRNSQWHGPEVRVCAAVALNAFIILRRKGMKRAQVRAGIYLSDVRQRIRVASLPGWLVGSAVAAGLVATGALAAYRAPDDQFRFAIIGDRTGEAVPGVWDQVWRETNADHPDFIVTVGDTIQGGSDATMDAEWRQIMQMLAPYRRKYKIFFTPGNHDVWSPASAQAFTKYTKQPLHYSFDYKQAHFTILDNSRSDEMPAGELAFLRDDLQKHASQPLKFVFSHRPSWILQVVLSNPHFELHQLAKQYGVQYVIAGHIHQMLHFELDGITYLSIASSGGHLRDGKQYEKGWFFQHTIVTVHGSSTDFAIEETGPPFGESRVTKPADWGAAGLIDKKETKPR
jgi:predicted phosphodiesterase